MFVDGNKRVALFAPDVFLRLNGRRFDVEGTEAHAFLLRHLEAGTLELEVLEGWIRQSIRQL